MRPFSFYHCEVHDDEAGAGHPGVFRDNPNVTIDAICNLTMPNMRTVLIGAMELDEMLPQRDILNEDCCSPGCRHCPCDVELDQGCTFAAVQG